MDQHQILQDINLTIEFVNDCFLQEPENKGKYPLLFSITTEAINVQFRTPATDLYWAWNSSYKNWAMRCYDTVMEPEGGEGEGFESSDYIYQLEDLRDEILGEKEKLIKYYLLGIKPEIEEVFELPEHLKRK